MANADLTDNRTLEALRKDVHASLAEAWSLVDIFRHLHEAGFDGYATLCRMQIERFATAVETYLTAEQQGVPESGVSSDT